ncbi:hypothetical protein NEAUS07_2335 [Nematocida ausubeli]|nr:hypothetical protein NEAUS07_2335 [Nematocida ausubeli]
MRPCPYTVCQYILFLFFFVLLCSHALCPFLFLFPHTPCALSSCFRAPRLCCCAMRLREGKGAGRGTGRGKRREARVRALRDALDPGGRGLALCLLFPRLHACVPAVRGLCGLSRAFLLCGPCALHALRAFLLPCARGRPGCACSLHASSGRSLLPCSLSPRLCTPAARVARASALRHFPPRTLFATTDAQCLFATTGLFATTEKDLLIVPRD